MREFSMRRVLGKIIAAAVLAIWASFAVHAQANDDLVALNQSISELYSAGKYREAIPLAEKSLGLTRTQNGEDHIETVTRVGWLAVMYERQGRYAEAEPLHRRVLGVREESQGPDHPDYARALNNLAHLYVKQGRLAEAEPLATRSLAILEKALGSYHPDVGRLFGNLAVLYQEQGRYAEAEPLAMRALGLHPDIGKSLNNLARLYDRQGRFREAEPLYKRSLDYRESTLPREHSDIGTSLSDLAAFYRGQNRFAEAEPLNARALSLRESALGPDHPDVATSLNEMASLYRVQGRYDEAKLLCMRALSLREKTLGPDHPDLAASLNQMATQYLDQGLSAEAEPLIKRSLAIREKSLGSDHPEVASSLDTYASLFANQNRHAEAELFVKRSLAIREKALGTNHPDTARTRDNLSALYKTQSSDVGTGTLSKPTVNIPEEASRASDARPTDFESIASSEDISELRLRIFALSRSARYSEAIPLARRELELVARQLGTDHSRVGDSTTELAKLYQSLGRYAEAAPLFSRALFIAEKSLGPNHSLVAIRLSNLAEAYRALGRYMDAEPLYLRALMIEDGPTTRRASLSRNLAALYYEQGRHLEGQELASRSASIFEKVLGPHHADLGAALEILGAIHQAQGQYAESEEVRKRVLSIFESAFGLEHPRVASSLTNLADLYIRQRRYPDAEPLVRRDLIITEKTLGFDHPELAAPLVSLAEIYKAQDRYAEAEPLYHRALVILEKSRGPDHPTIGTALDNLAGLYQSQERHAEAELICKRALLLREKALGPDHPDVAISLDNLAGLYRKQSRTADALVLYNRALEILEKAFGPEHPEVQRLLNNLGVLYFLQRDFVTAANYWRQSTELITRRQKREKDAVRTALSNERGVEKETRVLEFIGLVKVTWAIVEADRTRAAELASEMFKAAQSALRSKAAASLAQMAIRGAQGDPRLAIVVRERQDLVAEWQKLDSARTAAVSRAPDKRDRAAEATDAARLAAIDTRIAEIDKRLAAEFPDYAALSQPESLSVEEVQFQLGNDEALVLFLDTPEWKVTPEETFIWVITKTDARWVRSTLGTEALTDEVAALRCGLDSAPWDDISDAGRCRDLLKAAPTRDAFGNIRAETLPFDLARGHALYKSLFGQVEDLIRDKHLLLVPSGSLTQLPFHVLVTSPTAGGDYRAAQWLARKHALTVLPAVSSLKALRRVAKPSAATKPMIGIGNPLLDGDQDDPTWGTYYKKQAALARQKQACPRAPWQRVAALMDRRRGALPMATRNGRPDLDHLRMQAPLHDTADELCAVGKELRLARDDILLGARATEAMVKRLSAEGHLASYRVLHFATHGTLSGEISGTREPGLILTPPDVQTETDDGYLSASEVAALKLDADWVVLSACNTAAGGADGAEALSGLARAFFYAGARAMLVSHWAVNSAATVKLVTAAVGATTRKKALGRSEALRRAMLALIDKGKAREAHPAYWAPFVVVGEGAAAN